MLTASRLWLHLKKSLLTERGPLEMQMIRAGLDHIDALVPLVDAYRQFYKQPSDIVAVRAYLESRLSNNNCVVFIAYEGQEAVGFTLLYHHWTTVALGHVWLLNDLFTKAEARRKGIGEALLKHAADFAKADGAKRIWLRTAVDNFIAQALYEKFGYKRDEHFYRYDFVF
jgi:ribosomal protein S18 acetylase RimI-like enzyme